SSLIFTYSKSPLFFFILPHPPTSTFFPYTTLFRSHLDVVVIVSNSHDLFARNAAILSPTLDSMPLRASLVENIDDREIAKRIFRDRKSTRLNSSHLGMSYAVFCLK